MHRHSFKGQRGGSTRLERARADVVTEREAAGEQLEGHHADRPQVRASAVALHDHLRPRSTAIGGQGRAVRRG